MIKQKEFSRGITLGISMMNCSEILNILKEYKKENGEKYGVLKIGIFGSAVRGTMGNQSDLDIVVDLREQDLFSLVGIK